MTGTHGNGGADDVDAPVDAPHDVRIDDVAEPEPLDDHSSDLEALTAQPPLADTIRPAISGMTTDQDPPVDVVDPFGGFNEQTMPGVYLSALQGAEDLGSSEAPPVALGETLQLVRYARRGDTLLINGITPHGRRLTFEQRADRQGWYVVAAGRRRRPSKRELGLVVATITQEMEAALIPDREAEVRSAYRLAIASDQPGLPVSGLDAYRDVLLDECSAFVEGQTERIAVVAAEYQAFKRFAIRHGHRVGAAFVRALGERLQMVFGGEKKLQVFHKSGKAFRLVIVDRSSAEVAELVERLVTQESKEWLVTRVWGEDRRTHLDEVNFHIGIATTFPSERDSDYHSLAQRLSDDAYRAGKLGQLKGHTSIVLAKADYRTTIYRWNINSENELQELAADMDDGPAEVMAEMSDYLHELVQADLEGMAVAGDLNALIYCAIAREGFWQGTTAMRIAGDRLVKSWLSGEALQEGENPFVGGFDLGDEFYGIAVEEGRLYFARGDINSAGVTRVRAGLDKVQQAVGWRRDDGGGIVGRFLDALDPAGADAAIVDRIRSAAAVAFEENSRDLKLHVNDSVDIADFLYTLEGVQVTAPDIVEGAELLLKLPEEEPRTVKVLARRTGFLLRLGINGDDLPGVVSDSITGPQVRLRIRKTVASASICILQIDREQLSDLLTTVREDNHLADDHRLDVVSFLRHVADILLEYRVKIPGKVHMALGQEYDVGDFVGVYTLEDVRERHPGLYYEAVHHDLITHAPGSDLDRYLSELIGHTMLTSLRAVPSGRVSERPDDA